MPYVTKGVGAGEIHINVRSLGVRQNDDRTLEATIKLLKDIEASSVRISYNGDLACRVSVGKLSGGKLDQVMCKVEEKVKQLCLHKAKVPGPGSERRKSKPRNEGTNKPAQLQHH